MGKRYYYTDPRIAAYMHETFGFGFVENFEVEEMYVEGRLSKATHPARLHVREESLHLLEPRVGDVISDESSVEDMEGMIDDIHAPKLNLPPSIYITNSANAYLFDATCVLHRILTVENFNDIYGECFFENTRVIQRDGNPFHWPECDN